MPNRMTRRLKDRERDSEFEEFVVAQRGPLVRMARLLTAGDDAFAEDLVQTTLTRLYVAWPRVRRAGNPVGYARTSLTHAFVDERRRPYRRESPTDAVPDTASYDDHAGGGGTAVLAALAALPPRQRAVVVLRHLSNLLDRAAGPVPPVVVTDDLSRGCLLYTSPSPRDRS